MRRVLLVGISAAAGCCLGAYQVVRENHDQWDAVHASLVTIIVQTGAGALIGGVFAGVAMFYLRSRLLPGRRRPLHGTPAQPSHRSRSAEPVRPAPNTVRHVLIILFAGGLLTAGGIVVLACLRHPSIYGLLRAGFGGVFLMGLGAFLIWDDFVAPRLGDRARDKP